MPDLLSDIGDILISAFFAIMGYAGIHLSVGAESLSEIGTAVSYLIVVISVFKLVKHFFSICFSLKSRS